MHPEEETHKNKIKPLPVFTEHLLSPVHGRIHSSWPRDACHLPQEERLLHTEHVQGFHIGKEHGLIHVPILVPIS